MRVSIFPKKDQFDRVGKQIFVYSYFIFLLFYVDLLIRFGELVCCMRPFILFGSVLCLHVMFLFDIIKFHDENVLILLNLSISQQVTPTVRKNS